MIYIYDIYMYDIYIYDIYIYDIYIYDIYMYDIDIYIYFFPLQAAKKRGNGILSQWVPAIRNNFWHCAKESQGDVNKMKIQYNRR